MSTSAACVHCQVDSGCVTQANFQNLVVSASPFDENLVEVRMVKGSGASYTIEEGQSQCIENKQNSNYCLARFLSSMAKLQSILIRRPRAKTDLEALFPPVQCLQRSNTK